MGYRKNFNDSGDKAMKVWTLSIFWNEERMARWFIRHYEPWVERMVVWLEPSSDKTYEVLKQCPKVDLRKWPHRGLDDDRFTEAVNSWYHEARGKADWVGFFDADELLFHENILSVLEKADGDIFPSTGYALISKTGWPESHLKGQLYDHVRTGVRQPNYDKQLLHRPKLNVTQAVGRHVYSDKFPKHDGKLCTDAGLKLLHAHHTGGIDDTAARNRRNYARALNKNHAWNFAPGHNENPKQLGSVAWVADAIKNNRLIDVFTGQPIMPTVPATPPPSTGRLPMVPSPASAPAKPSALKKVQFGSGSAKFEGWINLDIETNITKKLPFFDGSVSHVYCSHLIEHVTSQQAWGFFTECYRILVKDGRLRIAIPDFTKLERDMTEEYQQAVKKGGHGDGSKQSALKACVFAHGHQSVWNSALLRSFLKAIGFTVSAPEYGKSSDSVMCNRETHGAVVGESVARTETSICEGVKQ